MASFDRYPELRAVYFPDGGSNSPPQAPKLFSWAFTPSSSSVAELEELDGILRHVPSF
jgi:hypothetical protein